jgi:hypothetical protein
MSSGTTTSDNNRTLIKASDMDEELLVIQVFREKSKKYQYKPFTLVNLRAKLPIS